MIRNCRTAILLTQESLKENSFADVPAALIIRAPDTGDLMLSLVNQEEYYLAPEFEFD